jgi:hypothetical protein
MTTEKESAGGDAREERLISGREESSGSLRIR